MQILFRTWIVSSDREMISFIVYSEKEKGIRITPPLQMPYAGKGDCE